MLFAPAIAHSAFYLAQDGTLEEADKLQTLWLRKEDIQYYEVFDSICAVAPHMKICIGSSPQEAVPFATMCVLGPEDTDAELLGKPVANTRVSASAWIRGQSNDILECKM